MAPFPLFALTAPPLAVAMSDGPAFASMALLALVLAALSITARRVPCPGRGPRAGERPPSAVPTRVRS